jgi:hypothetical protein
VVRRIAVLVGLAVLVVATFGLVFNWFASTSTTVRTSSAPAKAEAASAFFPRFVTAVRRGDATFLFDRFDPAVLTRYGATQCQGYTAQLADPSVDLKLIRVEGPAAYNYTSDGHSASIPDTYTFHVEGTVGSRAGQSREYHFALVGGRFLTFADCGNAIAGA